MDTALEQARAELVAAGILPAGAPADQVTDLVVRHARGLDGIEELGSLQTLSLIGCDLDDWARLAALADLSVLAIEHSTLADLGWIGSLPLTVAVLRCNRIVDAGPLGATATLQSVDLRGNPLSSASYAWARDVLGGRTAVLLDDEEAWQLCRSVQHADQAAVVHRDARGLRAAWTGLAVTTAPEAEHAVVTRAEVLAALEVPGGLRDLIPIWQAVDD